MSLSNCLSRPLSSHTPLGREERRRGCQRGGAEGQLGLEEVGEEPQPSSQTHGLKEHGLPGPRYCPCCPGTLQVLQLTSSLDGKKCPLSLEVLCRGDVCQYRSCTICNRYVSMYVLSKSSQLLSMGGIVKPILQRRKPRNDLLVFT